MLRRGSPNLPFMRGAAIQPSRGRLCGRSGLTRLQHDPLRRAKLRLHRTPWRGASSGKWPFVPATELPRISGSGFAPGPARRRHYVSRPARGSEERKRGRKLSAFFAKKIRDWRCSGHGNTLVGHGGLHWHADANRRFKSAAPEPGSSAEARSAAAPLICRRPGFERCSRRSSAADRCRSSNRAWPPTTDPCRQAPRSSAR